MNDPFSLHKKYAPNQEEFDRVWSHSCIVARIVEERIHAHFHLNIQRELAMHGALLHDIGAYFVEGCPCHPKNAKNRKEPYIKHGFIGAEILRKEGFPEALANIVERHIGSGITKKEILSKHLPLPAQNFVPETIEEKLVAYADNFHSKKPKFNSYDEIVNDLARYGKENVKRLENMRMIFGIPNIDKF